MKRTLFVLAIVVPAGALVGLLLDSGARMFGTSPSLATKSRAGDGVAADPMSRPSAISLSEGTGSELFLQRDGEVEIAGAPVRYARSYAAAGSYFNGGSGVLIATDPVMVFNSSPRNEHDVARLLVIDTAGGGKDARRALEAAFGSRNGIRARQARIEGEADLSRITRIQFVGDVEATLVDPEVPDGAMSLTTERLVLDFDGREVSSVSTDAAFTLTRRSGDLTLTGRGLEVSVRDDRARLLHDVHVTGILPGRKPADTPFTLTTPGPVDVGFGKRAPGKRGSFALANSRTTTTGGVAFSQGSLRGSARDATVVCGEKGAIETVELVGDVWLADADGEARGSRLVVTPRDTRVFARLEGTPVTVRPSRDAMLLPGQIGEGAILTTSGTLTISPIRPRQGPGNPPGRTTVIGPEVTVEGPTGRLVAERAVVFSSSEPDPAVQFHVTLDRVEARDAETEIKADHAKIARGGVGPDAEDRITLYGRYDVLHKPKPKPASNPAAGAAGDVPSFSGGPIRVKGGGSLEMTRPLSPDRPVVVVIREAFRAEALDPANDRAPLRGSLEAESARAELESTGRREPGAAPRRELSTFVAEGKVEVDLPGHAKAHGARLSRDARRRELVLSGGPDDLARVDRTLRGSKDWLRAVTMTFQEDLLRVVATQKVEGEIAMPPLPWVGIPPAPRGQTVMSALRAHRLVAHLDAARYRKGEISATEVSAEVNVKLTQPERVLTADAVSFDTTRRSGSVRGSPLRYTVIRHVDGAELGEGIACPAITLDGTRIVVEGPAEGIFHARRGLGIPQGKEGDSRPAAEPLEPVHLKLARRAVLLDEVLIAEGRVSLQQGVAKTGVTTAAADSALIFLERESGAETRSPRRDVGLVVLRGHAKYQSADLDAASDVMKINRVTRHAVMFNERPEKVTLILKRKVYSADVVNNVSRIDIDFTDPNDPAVTAYGHDIEVAPASRTSPQ